MGHKKLIRFEAIKGFPNVLQYPVGMAGRWKDFFKNDQPITLELACGKGEYTVGLAAMHPDGNFIGVDIKGNRLYVGAKRCLEQQLANAAFLRTQIDKITDYFDPGEVKDIWLTFPDPQLRISRAKKRLTHPRFLRLYQQILVNGGYIHLKTDSPRLYHFTKRVIGLCALELVTDYDDVYALGETMPAELSIKTHYEGLDIARSQKIHYLCFRLPQTPLPLVDQELHELIKLHEAELAEGGN